MVAVADDQFVYVLEFTNRRGLAQEIEQIQTYMHATIMPGCNMILDLVGHELQRYFNGELKTFTVPKYMNGTVFQQQVWDVLINIPYGQTRTYAEIAALVGKPTAYRAVAQAIGANQFALAIPCHRVVNTSGKLGGYAAGIKHKKWLLVHEKK